MTQQAELDARYDAQQSGGLLDHFETVDTSLGPQPVGFFVFPDGWSTARFLARRCVRSTQHPAVQSLGQSFRAQYGTDAGAAVAIHRHVQDNVLFVREKVERFQSAAYTLFDARHGDCDDHACAVFALAWNAGLPARLAFLESGPEPVHVFAEIFHDGQWHAAETTIAARYNEAPLAAAKRLRLDMRPDISGKTVYLPTQPSQLAGLGDYTVGHDLTTTKSYTVPPNGVVRLALEVSALTSLTTVQSSLADLGFVSIEAIDDRTLLTLDWPADWRNMYPTGAANRIVWVQCKWPKPTPQTFTRDDADWTVRGALGVDITTPPLLDQPP
ncbi:MAG: transglutaminase family protein, partial [Gemmatimonadales bacterium]